MTIAQTRVEDQIARVSLTPASSPLSNAVTPVSRLPQEILVHIFLCCVHRYYYYENWADVGVPQWVNVSYVCSFWRYVALSCPTLWSYMSVACSRWTDVSLARSMNLPLWVRVHMSPLNRQTALEFIKQVAPHAERFRECHLNLPSGDAEVVLPMLSSRSAPLICTLNITCRHPRFHWNWMDMDGEVESDVSEGTQAVNPHSFFNGDTPALRALHLKDYHIPWCSPALSGLTVLQLCDLHYSVRPTIAELSVVLSRIPDLVRLHLDNAIRDGIHDPASLGVHLPLLAHLLVSASFSTIVRFLSCIHIPATTQVRLGCSLEAHPNGDDYSRFYEFLSQRFSNLENEANSVTPVRTLVMDHMLRRMFIVFNASHRKCSRPECSLSLFKDCDCDIPLKVDIDSPPATTHWKALVVGICRSIPLASLNSLILNGCRLPSTLWLNILWNLRNLRYIAIIGGELVDLLVLLMLSPRPLPDNEDQRTSQPFAPSLEELYLEGVGVPQVYLCGGDPSIHGKHVTFLCDALARRRAVGHPLKRLVINGGFTFTKKEVRRLEEVIPQVGVHDGARLLEDFEGCRNCRPKEEAFAEDVLFNHDI